MSFLTIRGGRDRARPSRRERPYRPEIDRLESRTLQTANLGIEPSALEQSMLQMINRARANPAQEAIRLATLARTDPILKRAISETEIRAFLAEMSRHAPVSPLAFNPRLIASSRAHDLEMLRSNSQFHSDLRTLSAPMNATQAASDGQPYLPLSPGTAWAAAENVFAYSSNLPDAHGKALVDYFHAAFLLDWGNPEFGHLRNLLAPGPGEVVSGQYPMSEIGIGIITDVMPSSQPGYAAIASNQTLNVGPALVTQQLAWRAGHQYLTGSAFLDQDHDGFYSLGEGLSSVTIEAVGLHGEGRFTTNAWSSGGFTLELPAGVYLVTASGGGLATAQSRQISITNGNVEWNVMQTPDTPAPAAISAPSRNTPAGLIQEPGREAPQRAAATPKTASSGLVHRSRRPSKRRLRNAYGKMARRAHAIRQASQDRLAAVNQADEKKPESLSASTSSPRP